MKLALIAHDGKKSDMVAFVMKRLDFFNRDDVSIVTTGTTGKKILHAGVDKVEAVASGPLGGDAEIGAMVTRGEIDGVFFFRDRIDNVREYANSWLGEEGVNLNGCRVRYCEHVRNVYPLPASN